MARLRYGIHRQLEAEADALIKQSLALDGPSLSSRSDVLTRDKELLRRRREVLVPSGTPDPALRQGMYNRAANRANPSLNSRDGHASMARPPRGAAPPAGHSADGLRSFVERMFDP